MHKQCQYIGGDQSQKLLEAKHLMRLEKVIAQLRTSSHMWDKNKKMWII